ERVPALDAVNKSLPQKEIQSPVDRDRGRPPVAFPGDMLNEIISAERLRAGGEKLQHPRAHGRQPLAALQTETFGALKRGIVIMGMRMAHIPYVTLFVSIAS